MQVVCQVVLNRAFSPYNLNMSCLAYNLDMLIPTRLSYDVLWHGILPAQDIPSDSGMLAYNLYIPRPEDFFSYALSHGILLIESNCKTLMIYCPNSADKCIDNL